MYYLPHFDRIDIASIDFADRTYMLSPLQQVTPDEELIESIRQFGILHPPILKHKDNKSIIVTGRKRVLAARQARPDEEIICLMIPEEVEEEFVYRLIVEEIFYRGQLSLVEQAKLLDNFLKLRPVEDALPLLAKLGHKPQNYILEELTSLLILSRATLLAVHNGIIPLKAALKIRKLSGADQELLVQIISSLHLGGSKQHKLIDYCTELIMRHKVPLDKLLREFTIGDAPDKYDNIPQKATALLRWLHKQCFPKTTKAEDEFRKSVASLLLPDHIQLEHSPSFEDDRVTLSVNFPDLETVHNVLPEILRISNDSNGH